MVFRSCGKAFKKVQQARNHMKRMGPHHDSKCRLCPPKRGGRYFEAKTWAENLKHFDEFHGGEKQLKCGQCPDKFYPTELQLKRHTFKCRQVWSITHFFPLLFIFLTKML